MRKEVAIFAVAMVFTGVSAYAQQTQPRPGQEKGRDEKLEVEVVTLTRHGLSPATISKRGAFILMIEDESGTLEGTSLVIEDDKKVAKERVDVPAKGRHGASILRLTPGQYKAKIGRFDLAVEVKP